jgi:replication factor C large subunit
MLYASAIGRERLEDREVHTSQKDERGSIFSLITALFRQTSDDDLMRLSYEVDDTPETIEQWIEGNLLLLPDLGSTGRAYRCLSRSDEYLGYTYRRQYHTLWRYATAIMLMGTADAAGGVGIHTRIMPPERWQKMAAAKKQKTIRSALLNKVAGIMHIPQNTLREKYLVTLSLLVENNPSLYARSMAFDADQLNFFLNDRARSQEVIKAVLLEEKEKEKELKAREKEYQKKTKTVKPEEIMTTREENFPPEPPEKKIPTKSQATLFDGF